MLGMLLVNFYGSFELCPRLLRHTNDYCSFADTIMPQFLFAAGFALRLTLLRRLEVDGRVPWSRVLRRIPSLAAVAILWYSVTDLPDLVEKFHTQPLSQVLRHCLKRQWFQTLMHIAATSLWILPVILCSLRTRLLFAVASAALHAVLSAWFAFAWAYEDPRAIDGGPLGFLSWSLPALAGTWACDLVRHSNNRSPTSPLPRLTATGFALATIGWLLAQPTTLYQTDPATNPSAPALATDPVIPHHSRLAHWNGTLAEPPFVPPPPAAERQWNYWMMSQRACTISYTVFTAGWSILIFALIHRICHASGFESALLRTLGTNSLAAYILHDVVGWCIAPCLSRSASYSAILAGWIALTVLTAAGCRLLERQGWFLRV